MKRVREVQDYLTAFATQNLPEIRHELKLNNDDVAAMFAKARDKGLGLWGETESGSDQPEVDPVSSMEAWLTGSHKLIIADEMVAAELLAFREHIHHQRSALIHTEAWDATWAPLLVFLNVVLDKFPPEMLVAGQAIAEEMEIVYEDLD